MFWLRQTVTTQDAVLINQLKGFWLIKSNNISLSFQAQESPEPIYDLMDCGLKTIPSGVFSKCKVLRKEALLLQVRRTF